MRNRSHVCFRRVLVSTVVVAGVATAAFGAGSFHTDRPARFLPGGVDRHLVQLTTPDSRVIAAWSYRNGAEYDVAFSERDALGRWSEPALIGFGNGHDDVQPALALDDWGTVYLAHADRQTGAVILTVLPAGAERWTAARTVSLDGERASSPTLLLVADRLVIGYRSGPRVVIRDLRIAELIPRGNGVQDGPDGFPPTGSQTPGIGTGGSGNR